MPVSLTVASFNPGLGGGEWIADVGGDATVFFYSISHEVIGCGCDQARGDRDMMQIGTSISCVQLFLLPSKTLATPAPCLRWLKYLVPSKDHCLCSSRYPPVSLFALLKAGSLSLVLIPLPLMVFSLPRDAGCLPLVAGVLSPRVVCSSTDVTSSMVSSLSTAPAVTLASSSNSLWNGAGPS